MEKELKRYVLAEYAGFEERIYDSKEEYDKLIDIINKHNKKSKKRLMFGNVYYSIVENNRYRVIVNKYNKLTSKMTISEIDNLTSKFESEKELEEEYKNKLLTKINEGYKPSIRIIYLEDKNSKEKTLNDPDRGIKNIPVLYGEELKYFDKDYLFKCIRYYLNNYDLGFFLDLANSFDSSKDCLEDIENIRILVNKCREDSNYLEGLMIAVKNLYTSYILERKKDGSPLRDKDGKEIISQRRKRDFVFFVKNYHMSERKKYFPINKIEEPNHELFDLLSQREEREQDFMEEEDALDAWDKGIIYRRK